MLLAETLGIHCYYDILQFTSLKVSTALYVNRYRKYYFQDYTYIYYTQNI